MFKFRRLSTQILMACAVLSSNTWAEECKTNDTNSPTYLEAGHLYNRGTPKYKKVERWDDLAVSISIVATDGFTLTRDLVISGKYPGKVEAGTVFDKNPAQAGKFCSVLIPKKGQPYLCIEDTDGDKKFDTGHVSKRRDLKKAEVISIADQNLFASNQSIVDQANEISDLPFQTIVYGSGIQVRKANKKEIKVSYGHTVTSRTKMSAKTIKRCGEICMAFNGGYTDITVKAKNLHPVEFGGVTLNFKFDESGEILVSSEGELSAPSLERSCDGLTFTVPGTTLTRHLSE